MAVRKLMVADDEGGIRNLITATLRDDSRYTLLSAKNGDEALQMAIKEKPDLIFLDIMMSSAGRL